MLQHLARLLADMGESKDCRSKISLRLCLRSDALNEFEGLEKAVEHLQISFGQNSKGLQLLNILKMSQRLFELQH